MKHLPRIASVLSMALLSALFVFGPAMAEDGKAVHAAAYVSGIEDLPLMDGLTEAPGGALVFDTPGGRIVEAYAYGALSRREVLDFYAATLPQLGWKRIQDAAFSRENEILRLEFTALDAMSGKGPGVSVRFALSPGAAMSR